MSLQVTSLRLDVGPKRSRRTVFSDVSLEVRDSEMVAIMGRSGAGKSSILRILASLVRATEGAAFVNATNISALSPTASSALRRRDVALVFQDYNLVETLTAVENVCLPLELVGVARAEAMRQANQALTELGIEPLANQLPSRLSGGEQQRVAVSRALLSPGRNVLADEPTGAVDEDSGRAIVALLRRVAEAGKAVLMVTHDPWVASQADRVIDLVDGTALPR